MDFPEINNCPGTLAKGFTTYSKTCLKNIFNNKKVSHILPYQPSHISEENAEIFRENRLHISISGVQEKLSIILKNNKLRLTNAGEQGTHILKPIPKDLKNVDQVPANEHLTMQIAKQIYGINTAENAVIFFKNGEIAYITKRFDVKDDGKKLSTEDFASLAGKTAENAGPDYKYKYSYEELASLIKKYIPAYIIEIEKYFVQVVFNYLFSNGDAHLKNFSILESTYGDYFLSPAYDLINTHMHVNDSDFALENGLFKDDFQSNINYNMTKEDFLEFGIRIGIKERRINKSLSPFIEKQPDVEQLTKRSFLNNSRKKEYILHYNTKLNILNSK